MRIYAIVSFSSLVAMKLLPRVAFLLFPSPGGVDGVVDSGILAEYKEEDSSRVKYAIIVYFAILRLAGTKPSIKNYFNLIKSHHHRDFHPIIVWIVIVAWIFCSYFDTKSQEFDV